MHGGGLESVTTERSPGARAQSPEVGRQLDRRGGRVTFLPLPASP
jgi:hypothetical protein